MPYRVTFVLGSFDGDRQDETRKVLRHQSLYECLAALTRIDLHIILAAKGKIPKLYDSGIRYRMEPPGQEDWLDVLAALSAHRAEKEGGPQATIDCFPKGTLLLRDDYELVKIEDIKPGDRIWGYKDWTTVEKTWYKGTLPVDAIQLNNGSVMQLTGDHKVYVARCPVHRTWKCSRYGCSCQVSEREIERIRVSELAPMDVLIQPDRLPFGKGEMDPGRAYIEGLYIADGWSSTNTSFFISGQDGCPKEAQKREVESICDRLDVGTTWGRKAIGVYDREWSLRMHLMGQRAREKHFLSLDMNEETALESLRGVMADSKTHNDKQRGWTFTTTSRLLATQVRILQKMAGRTCSTMYIENHGGLGKNPIYRLGVRDPLGKKDKLLRVKEIAREVAEVPCYDIQTSDHYVYLPEHDVTVSNCEDLCCWRAAELQAEGIAAHPVFVWRKIEDGSHLYHIVVRYPDGRIEDPSRRLGMK